jgi:uncharacterized protein YggE
MFGVTKEEYRELTREHFKIEDTLPLSPLPRLEELLIRATENARRKAEVLARASNVTLGDLISIDYNWGDLYLYSNTSYMMENNCLAFKTSAPDIEPDDIEVSDTVTFVWEIK